MREKQKQKFEPGSEGRRRQERQRKEWEQWIGEIARYRGIELKTLKKMAQDRASIEMDNWPEAEWKQGEVKKKNE